MPLAVKYGIPMEQFYRLTPKLFMRYQPYMLAWAKNYHYGRTEMGWITGRYVSHAVGANFSKSHKYPSTPEMFYDFGHDEEPEEERFTDFDRFKAFAAMFNKQFELRHKPAEETTGDDETLTAVTPDGVPDGDITRPTQDPETNECHERHEESGVT